MSMDRTFEIFLPGAKYNLVSRVERVVVSTNMF